MDKQTLHGMWNYYLMLECDIDNSSRYVEPAGQENVYSFEFAKLIILACTEAESVFKAICHEIDETAHVGNIRDYKSMILGKYPKITDAVVVVNRLEKSIEPFKGWDTGSLEWWTAYNDIKHNRGSKFSEATYINAVTALAALYILILYLAQITGIEFQGSNSKYIDSDYIQSGILLGRFGNLPDFEENKNG